MTINWEKEFARREAKLRKRGGEALVQYDRAMALVASEQISNPSLTLEEPEAGFGFYWRNIDKDLELDLDYHFPSEPCCGAPEEEIHWQAILLQPWSIFADATEMAVINSCVNTFCPKTDQDFIDIFRWFKTGEGKDRLKNASSLDQ